jgi:hypothetical protein
MLNFVRSLWNKFQDWRYERKCIKHLGVKPQKMYVSKEAYDELVRIINAPPDPKVQESLKKLLERKSPWEDE